MKNFAGINLDTINTSDFTVLLNISKTFRLNFCRKMEEPNLKNYLSDAKRESVIKHLENYLKMKDNLYLTQRHEFIQESSTLMLKKAVKIAADYAPNDWVTKGEMCAKAMWFNKYLDNFQEKPEEGYVGSEIESAIRDAYKHTMDMNLVIAKAKLEEIAHLADNIIDNEISSYILSMQIAHYINILHFLYLHEMDDSLNMPDFMLKVIYAIAASVSALKQLPEDEPEQKPKAGYFKSLMFSTWFGAETKSPAKANSLKMGVQL